MLFLLLSLLPPPTPLLSLCHLPAPDLDPFWWWSPWSWSKSCPKSQDEGFCTALGRKASYKKLTLPPPSFTPLPSALVPSLSQVAERFVSVQELLQADEVFCTGTAVVGTPVGSVTYQGQR